MYKKMPGERHTLKEWRKLNGLSTKELARQSGVHFNSIWRWENEIDHAQVGKLKQILKVMGLDLYDLIFMP